ERSTRYLRIFVQIVSRVQRIVIVEPESASMKVICSTLGDDIHHRAGGAAILRRELIRDEVYLLNDIRIVDRLLTASSVGIVTVLTIDHVVVGTEPHSIGRKRVYPKTQLST